MNLGLGGRTALVAAASQGIGKAVALALAREGADVAIFARGEAGVLAAAREIEAEAPGCAVLPLTGDVTDADQVRQVVAATIDRFGAVDILFNNAAGPKPGLFEELSDRDWEDAFWLNLMSAVRLTRACLPAMRARHWGRIITSTSSAVKQPHATLMLSNSIRSATVAWGKTLADQVAADGITVNTLAPGSVDTENLRMVAADAARRAGVAVEEMHRANLAAIPVGRYGEPDEIAAVVAFLASEQAAYLTGVTLLVDGGRYRGVS